MTDPAPQLQLGRRLRDEVIAPMKLAFVAKDEVIDLLGIALVSGENIFLHGPPGTAKSALVHDLCARLHGRSFDYLLTRFTEPNELFGPFDIRKLREGNSSRTPRACCRRRRWCSSTNCSMPTAPS